MNRNNRYYVYGQVTYLLIFRIKGMDNLRQHKVMNKWDQK